jgi:tetratricopeptide (TPR) repeat protein
MMRKNTKPLTCILFIFWLFLLNPAYAQDLETNRFSKRIENIASEYYRIGDYKKALDGYLMLDSMLPETTGYNYLIGLCYLRSSRKQKAYPYLEFAYNQEDAPEDILIYLARAYHYGMEFEKAIISYESFKKQIQFVDKNTRPGPYEISEIDLYIQQCHNGLRLVREPLLNSSVINLGPAINSEYADFAPLIDKNEEILIFTSKRKATNNTKSDPLTGQYFENVFYSKKVENKWKNAISIGEPINRDHVHNSAVGLSPTGETLFMYQGNDNSFSARISGDLYISKNVNNQWGEPIFLKAVNSKSWESSASISEDETILIISSDREGGFGGIDLYISRKKQNGEWTLPDNLGGYINTQFDEDGPFLHPDGNKLYFSSKGHNTMGGYDIFYSEFLTDKNRWTRPVNMGYPVNTPDDDIFFIWTPDGERAYFSSEREDTYGETDIYVFIRHENDNDFVNTTGVILDKISQSPLEAELVVRDYLSNNLIGIFETEKLKGCYALNLKSARKYRITVKADGYNTSSVIIDIPQQQKNSDFIKNIILTRKK